MTIDATALASDLFGRMEKGWNDADGEAFAAPFTDDADFVDTRGFHHHGRAEIASSHVMILGTKFKGTTVRYEVEDAREIAADCVLAHARASMALPGSATPTHALLTIVMVIDGGEWKITALHNTMALA